MGVEERRSSALKSRRAGAGRSACLHADAGRAISTGGCGLQCGGEGNGMGGRERASEIAAVDFIVLKSSSSQRDARRRAAVPPLPLSLSTPPSHPPFSPQPRGKVPAGSRGRRQGMPGGGGAGAAAAVPPGSLRDYWGGGSGSGCCARLAAAAGGAGSLFC